MKKKEECQCDNEECKCGDNCQCGDECHCGDDCQCGDECHCGDDCQCGEECHCGDECQCHHESKKKESIFKGKKDNKLKKMQEENEKLQNEVMMAKADLVNYRKRKDEEVVRMLKYCNEDLIKQLLPIMDNFERAMKVGSEDEKMMEGIKMIYCNLENALSSFEVKPIDGFNKPFDPVYHNALLTEHKDEVEAGMVLEVLQRGYLYKDKVIRPAMVKVSE